MDNHSNKEFGSLSEDKFNSNGKSSNEDGDSDKNNKDNKLNIESPCKIKLTNTISIPVSDNSDCKNIDYKNHINNLYRQSPKNVVFEKSNSNEINTNEQVTHLEYDKIESNDSKGKILNTKSISDSDKDQVLSQNKSQVLSQDPSQI